MRRSTLHSMTSRSAILLMLSLGVLVSHARADEAKMMTGDGAVSGLPSTQEARIATGNGAATSSSPGAAADEVPSLGLPGIKGPSFYGGDAAIASGQGAATAGYELSGSGIGSARTPEQAGILTSASKGRAVRFDNGIFVYPALTTGIGYNDNVAGSSTNEKGSTVFFLRPELVAELKRSGDRYTFSYDGNFGRYASSSEDNFNHHDLWLAGDNYLTSRARLGWGVGYQVRSDARGATDRAGASEPDRWRAPVARVVGIYGAPKAIGRIELEGSLMQKRYENNRINTRASDVDTSMLSARFFYRFMPRTSLLFEARNTWAGYKLATSTQDNSDTRLYTGLVWDATAKTTGSIKLGRAYKNFDHSSRRDASAGSWEAGVAWTPMTYSKFELASSRAFADSTGTGNFVTNTGTMLAWTHKWASYMTSNLNAGYVKSDYDGINRDDKTSNYGIGFYRELGYNFRLGASWNHTKRDSNIDILDFERDVTMLTLEAIL